MAELSSRGTGPVSRAYDAAFEALVLSAVRIFRRWLV